MNRRWAGSGTLTFQKKYLVGEREFGVCLERVCVCSDAVGLLVCDFLNRWECALSPTSIEEGTRIGRERKAHASPDWLGECVPQLRVFSYPAACVWAHEHPRLGREKRDRHTHRYLCFHLPYPCLGEYIVLLLFFSLLWASSIYSYMYLSPHFYMEWAAGTVIRQRGPYAYAYTYAYSPLLIQ
jgi:hypothetical protein